MSHTRPAVTPARFDLLRAESFIRSGAMLALVTATPVREVCRRLEQSAVDTGHVIMARHDMSAALRGADGLPEVGRCLVTYEVGRTDLLAQLLRADPVLAHVMPLRIVVHDAHHVTTVTAVRPSVTWHELSHESQVGRIAQGVERGLQQLVRSLQ